MAFLLFKTVHNKSNRLQHLKTMTKLLIIDTETTSVKDDSQVCEISATLYNVSKNVRECGAIASVSFLSSVETNEAEHINGITPELSQVGFDNSPLFGYSLKYFTSLLQRSSYLVAFNANFDKEQIKKYSKRYYGETHPIAYSGQWLCAMNDFDWGYPNKSKKGTFSLINLALQQGIGVSTAHRAGDDVRLLVEVFNRNKQNLTELLDLAILHSESPTIVIQANVNYNNKDLAKDAGFSWNAEGYERAWTKKIKLCDFKDDYEFEVFQIA